MEDHDMNRRALLLSGSVALNAALLAAAMGGASAAQLPTSTVTVNVLSVDRESADREEARYPGRSPIVFETTKFLAKAQIAKVLKSAHGLAAGDVIDIRYSVTVRQPPDPAFRVKPTLSVGETRTLTVFGNGSSFTWRN
jgi:hypothetical protein